MFWTRKRGIFWTKPKDFEQTDEYDEEKDIEFYATPDFQKESSGLLMEPGMFVIFSAWGLAYAMYESDLRRNSRIGIRFSVQNGCQSANRIGFKFLHQNIFSLTLVSG